MKTNKTIKTTEMKKKVLIQTIKSLSSLFSTITISFKIEQISFLIKTLKNSSSLKFSVSKSE